MNLIAHFGTACQELPVQVGGMVRYSNGDIDGPVIYTGSSPILPCDFPDNQVTFPTELNVILQYDWPVQEGKATKTTTKGGVDIVADASIGDNWRIVHLPMNAVMIPPSWVLFI